jgi:4-aminobutyrate aminotransferase/(S)-3-amino-2-methylpropionate transaminase
MLPGTQVWSRARTKALFEEEQRYIAPGLQTIALLSELAIERGKGCTLTDLDGNTYLDLNAGVSVASLGHAHPTYVAALSAQLAAVTVGSFTTRARTELAKLFAELTPGNLDRVQFFSGGAEAVEAGIKLARSFTKRTDVVAFTGGFHGKTAGVLPISDVGWKDAVGPLPTGYHHAPFPDPTIFKGTPDECMAASLDALKKVIAAVPGGPAVIIIEPIQGTAGNLIPPAGFLNDVADIAHESGALFFADEMICGFGRTGLMFGVNHDGVVPDIMTTGKGMASGFPMSALVSRSDIMAAEPFSLPSASSSSYGGNPLAAAAGLVTIRTILEEGLVDNAARVGKIFVEGLHKIAARRRSIANVRGRGLLIGFDLVVDNQARELKMMPKGGCVQFFLDCLANGVIMMGYTPRVRVHPPLILTPDEASQALSVIDAALGQLEA